jgi:hypothetical protein
MNRNDSGGEFFHVHTDFFSAGKTVFMMVHVALRDF